MREDTFNNLVEKIWYDVAVDRLQSMRSTSGNDPIYPEMVVALGIRFLGGEQSKSLFELYRLSLASTDRVIDKFLSAVANCDDLAIKLPVGDELINLVEGFNSISTANGIFHGVVAALDGWLCTTLLPMIVINEGDFYSGHYKRYGINVQAVCDANLRFIYVCVAGPGRTNDNRAFHRLTKLRKWLQKLPGEYFIVSDGAYTLSKKIIVPFGGTQKSDEYKRSFNFYLSQLRIRIEMAFGRLTTKWRIFRRDLNFSLEKDSLIIEVACRLHNFVIDEEGLDFSQLNADNNDFSAFDILPLELGSDENNRGFLPLRPSELALDDRDTTRQTDILERIKEQELHRPEHNVIRNEELDDITVYTECDDFVDDFSDFDFISMGD